MNRPFLALPALALLLALPGGTIAAQGDAEAIRLAERTLDAMGGADAWNSTRYLTWNFDGRRLHHWDRFTGDVRMEADSVLVLMNVKARTGRAWVNGEEVTDAEALATHLETGYAWWINDSYWLVMPYKLLDDGVILRSAGESDLADGRAADLLVVTFDSVGLTPQNRYDVWIARDTGWVEQWAYYPDAQDPEPRFTRPWAGWKRFGSILLATDHGRATDWAIDAPAELPRALFESP